MQKIFMSLVIKIYFFLYVNEFVKISVVDVVYFQGMCLIFRIKLQKNILIRVLGVFETKFDYIVQRLLFLFD